jgi:2-C-methyl-D-erythritol 2,4-cyclodiphosphate synthase
MLEDKKVKPTYISAVIMAEKPKLVNFIPKIIENLSSIIGISVSQIGISATTLEGIGIVGREEGIACQSYVLCTKI